MRMEECNVIKSAIIENESKKEYEMKSLGQGRYLGKLFSSQLKRDVWHFCNLNRRCMQIAKYSVLLPPPSIKISPDTLLHFVHFARRMQPKPCLEIPFCVGSIANKTSNG